MGRLLAWLPESVKHAYGIGCTAPTGPTRIEVGRRRFAEPVTEADCPDAERTQYDPFDANRTHKLIQTRRGFQGIAGK